MQEGFVAALSLTLSLATSISPTFAADEGKKIVQPNLDENFWNDYNSWLANRIRIKGNDPGGSGMTLGVDSTLYYTTSGSFTKRTQYNGTAGGNYYTTTSSGGKLLGWGTTSGLGMPKFRRGLAQSLHRKDPDLKQRIFHFMVEDMVQC